MPLINGISFPDVLRATQLNDVYRHAVFPPLPVFNRVLPLSAALTCKSCRGRTQLAVFIDVPVRADKQSCRAMR